jgi:hypothetical protein
LNDERDAKRRKIEEAEITKEEKKQKEEKKKR